LARRPQAARAVLTPPIAGEGAPALLAPSPMVDRVPLVIGGAMTLVYISSAMRSAIDGIREPWVDLLDELIERDPHGYSVVSKRILAVAGGRIEVIPAVTEENDPEFVMAKEIAAFVSTQLLNIEDLSTTIASLLWGIYYGIAGAEIEYERTGTNWEVKGLSFLHPRRFWYPLRDNWDLFIAQGWQNQGGFGPAGPLGIRVADYPGKFIIHAPKLRGDYPTREGLGRQLAYWFALKGVGARAAVQYVEGYSRPKPIGFYATGPDGKPRVATDEDIAAAKNTLGALGLGTLSSGVLPDSIRIEMQRVEGGITHEAWMAFCNGEVTKAVLGQTGTTDIGKNGSRAQADTMREDQVALTRYDSMALATTLRRDFAKPLTALNFPHFTHLTPRVLVHAVENPDPDKVMARALQAVDAGMQIDGAKLAPMVGLPLAAENDKNARPLVSPNATQAAAPGEPKPDAKPTDEPVKPDGGEDQVH
jgi:phage gp29-like protein